MKRLVLLCAALVLAGCGGSENPLRKETVESVLREAGFGRLSDVPAGWVAVNAAGQERPVQVIDAVQGDLAVRVFIDRITEPRSRYRSYRAPAWTAPICNLRLQVATLDPRVDLLIQRLRRACELG